MAQWLERGALSMSLPVVRFRTSIGEEFSDKCHVSPLSILEHCCDVVSLDKAPHHQILHLTQVKMSSLPAAGLYALRGVEMTHK